jgi:hypothetical protein
MEEDIIKPCIIIDSVDRLFKMCVDEVCKVNGWSDPDDGGKFGKGWGIVRRVWEKTIHKIVMKGVPIVMIAHEKITKQMINRVEVDRISIGLSKAGKDIVADSSDFIFYYGLNEEDERTLFCKPSAEHEIGRRGSGELDMSPMEPSFKALDERIRKELGQSFVEIAPMVTIIGRPKIGKTTLASEFPNAVIFDCENGSKFLRKHFNKVYLCDNWNAFILGLKDLFNKGE